MMAQEEPPQRLLYVAVGVTLGAQALVVLASLTLPVLAAIILPSADLPPHMVGWYASGIFLAGAVATLLTPLFVARHGPVRVHQAMLALASGGLVALAGAAAPALAISALLIGLAYGPANPASSALLSRLAPPRLRNRVFSLKQVAVPLGGAAAGLLMPALAALAGWQAAALGLAVLLAAAALLVERWRRPLDDGRPKGSEAKPRLLAPFQALRRDGPALRLGATALCFAAVQFSFSAFLPTLLVQAAGWSIAAAGATLTVALAVSIGARIALGWVADRVPATRVLLGLGLAMAMACAAAAGIGPNTPTAAVFLVAGMFGFAAYGWNGVMLAEAARMAAPGGVAAVTAGTMMMVYVGATAGPSMFGAVFAALGDAVAGFVLLALFSLAPLLWLPAIPNPKS